MVRDSAPRWQSAAVLLSTTGAAVAGIGFGVLYGELLRPYGALIFAVGLFSHIVGMISRRRAQQVERTVRASWEIAAYWFCWLLIVVLAGYIAVGNDFRP